MNEEPLDSYVDYHVFGHRLGGKKTHLSSVWDRESAEDNARRYRAMGWKGVFIQEKPVAGGRCIRSQTVRDTNGRWVVVWLVEDLETIAQNMRATAVQFFECQLREHGSLERAEELTRKLLIEMGKTRAGAATTALEIRAEFTAKAR